MDNLHLCLFRFFTSENTFCLRPYDHIEMETGAIFARTGIVALKQSEVT